MCRWTYLIALVDSHQLVLAIAAVQRAAHQVRVERRDRNLVLAAHDCRPLREKSGVLRSVELVRERVRSYSEALPLLAERSGVSVFKSSLHTKVIHCAANGAALDVVADGQHRASVHLLRLGSFDLDLIDSIGAMLAALDLFR